MLTMTTKSIEQGRQGGASTYANSTSFGGGGGDGSSGSALGSGNGGPLVLEVVPVLREGIIGKGEWKARAQAAQEKVWNLGVATNARKAEVEAAAKVFNEDLLDLAEMYTGENVASLLGGGGGNDDDNVEGDAEAAEAKGSDDGPFAFREWGEPIFVTVSARPAGAEEKALAWAEDRGQPRPRVPEFEFAVPSSSSSSQADGGASGKQEQSTREGKFNRYKLEVGSSSSSVASASAAAAAASQMFPNDANVSAAIVFENGRVLKIPAARASLPSVPADEKSPHAALPSLKASQWLKIGSLETGAVLQLGLKRSPKLVACCGLEDGGTAAQDKQKKKEEEEKKKAGKKRPMIIEVLDDEGDEDEDEDDEEEEEELKGEAEVKDELGPGQLWRAYTVGGCFLSLKA